MSHDCTCFRRRARERKGRADSAVRRAVQPNSKDERSHGLFGGLISAPCHLAVSGAMAIAAVLPAVALPSAGHATQT